jgi:hypothetical protein
VRRPTAGRRRRPAPDARPGAGTLLTVLELAYAHWFFGNLYEAVVRIPNRLAGDPAWGASDPRLGGPLSPGSPIRYYLPGVPIMAGGTIAALAGATRPSVRRWVVGAAACSILGGALTAHLVRTVNLRLFVAGHPVRAGERQTLLNRWYRLNGVRLAAVGGAWLAAHMARRDLHASSGR